MFTNKGFAKFGERTIFNQYKEIHMAQILVVDDSSTVRNEVTDFLKKNGLTVAMAVDGKDGLAKLQADTGSGLSSVMSTCPIWMA